MVNVNMSERKVLLFILSVIFYCLYSVHMWFMTSNGNEKPLVTTPNVESQPDIKPNNSQTKHVVKSKVIPLFLKDACSALEVFTKKPQIDKEKQMKSSDIYYENNTITVIGITVFLVILVLNALLDVLKVKEEERARMKLNPNGERRQSLSEFANKKSFRRESSRFSLQLFQIAETVVSPSKNKDNKSRRETRPYTRGESINSYLSEKGTIIDNSAPASIGEVPTETRLAKRQSVAKLIGGRPAPMVRRSSYPALPLNPEIQALMLGSKQSSFDSDDEGDGKGRRVRIIRRF